MGFHGRNKSVRQYSGRKNSSTARGPTFPGGMPRDCQYILIYSRGMSVRLN